MSIRTPQTLQRHLVPVSEGRREQSAPHEPEGVCRTDNPAEIQAAESRKGDHWVTESRETKYKRTYDPDGWVVARKVLVDELKTR